MIETLSHGWFLVAGAALVLACLVLLRRRGPALTAATLADLRRRGAVVLDVRTPDEYLQGHLPGSRNLPLDRLEQHLDELDRDRPILTVCASGMRSAVACRRLVRAGFREVRNAGPWQSLAAALGEADGTRS